MVDFIESIGDFTILKQSEIIVYNDSEINIELRENDNLNVFITIEQPKLIRNIRV